MYMTGFVIVCDLIVQKRLVNSTRAMLKFEGNEDNVPDTVLQITSMPSLTMQDFRYDWSNLDGVYTELVHDGKVMFRFVSPKHNVIFDALTRVELEFFLNHLFFVFQNSNRKIQLNNDFNICFDDYMSADRYIRNVTDLGHLSTLVLENCVLHSLTDHIGNSPVSYLSLTGSTLGTTQSEIDAFWDWMSIDVICESLEILEMNYVDLNVLPFEIKFLSNLHTLSVAKNNLTCLPHCIGELKKLKQLFINNNKLKYLPGCLNNIIFRAINVSDNDFDDECNATVSNNVFMLPESAIHLGNSDKSVIQSLSELSLYSLVSNNIKFKRQDLPHTLWHYFDEFCRCDLCHKCVIPNNCIERYSYTYAKSYNFNKNIKITWQYFECRVRCYRSFIFNLYDDN